MHNQGNSNIVDWDMICFGFCYCI